MANIPRGGHIAREIADELQDALWDLMPDLPKRAISEVTGGDDGGASFTVDHPLGVEIRILVTEE